MERIITDHRGWSEPGAPMYTLSAVEKLRVACYIRVSTEDPSQEESFATQERYFTRLLGSRPNWDAVGVYADHGRSGTDRTHRTGLKRLLRHCEQGRIDRVICKSISRLSRNTADTVAIIRRLKGLGVTCYFEKEGLDTGDMKSEFILTTLAALAQEESRTISENLRWSLEKRAPLGDVPNHECYGYRLTDALEVTESGYRRRRVEIIPEEAAIIGGIFRYYAQGLTITDITRILNAKGLPAPDPACGWTCDRVRSILRNERYCGDVLTHKSYIEDHLTHKVRRNHGEVTQYYIRDHHPAIITREMFRTAQMRKLSVPPGRERREYPFSGRLVCGLCGKRYHVSRRNGSVLWICSGVRLCGAERLSQITLELMFLRAADARFPDAHELLAALEATQDLDYAERDRSILHKQIAILEDELDDAQQSCETLKNRLEILRTRREVFGEAFDEADVTGSLQEQKAAAEQITAERTALEEVLAAKEQHWALLERDYAIRAALIEQMQAADPALGTSLPQYVKALALSVTVCERRFTVRWFDGTETEHPIQ